MKLKELIKQYGNWDCVSTLTLEDGLAIQIKGPKPKTVWDFKKGDTQYIINPYGVVVPLIWDGDSRDIDRRDFGGVFATYEEAEKDLERCQVETLLLKHGGRRWFKDGGMNWLMSYDRELDEWRFLYSTRGQRQGAIYFDSKVELTEAVEQIGRDRIIKALFEVR